MIGSRSALALASLWIAVGLSAGCFVVHDRYVHGSGNLASETRELDTFNAVDVRGSADLHVRLGEPAAATIEADDNLLPLIKTDVTDGRLVISQMGSLHTSHGITVTVTTPSLDGVTISGSSDVAIPDFRGEQLELVVRGSADVRAAGEVDRLSARIDGSGELDLTGLVSRSAVASIRGSGEIDLHVTEELDASIAGSGDIRYAGGAEKVNSSVYGSGEVRPF